MHCQLYSCVQKVVEYEVKQVKKIVNFVLNETKHKNRRVRCSVYKGKEVYF